MSLPFGDTFTAQSFIWVTLDYLTKAKLTVEIQSDDVEVFYLGGMCIHV